MEEKLRIAHFTDPLCFWCYAMEPEVRKIRVLLDDQLDYRIVMGVLSADVREIIGFDEEAALRYEFFREKMVDHLCAAAKSVGMPFSFDALYTRKPEEFVSLPLSMAYCAMVMVDERVAEAYLRRMRECVYAEGRSLANVDDLVDLASEFPIDLELFRSYLESDAAAPVLQEGIDECRTYSVVAFPTLLMEYGETKAIVRGYQSYDELKRVITQITDGHIVLTDAEYSIHALKDYVNRFGKVAAREIQTMFSFNGVQLDNAMMDLASTGLYKTESCGSSYFVMAK